MTYKGFVYVVAFGHESRYVSKFHLGGHIGYPRDLKFDSTSPLTSLINFSEYEIQYNKNNSDDPFMCNKNLHEFEI